MRHSYGAIHLVTWCSVDLFSLLQCCLINFQMRGDHKNFFIGVPLNNQSIYVKNFLKQTNTSPTSTMNSTIFIFHHKLYASINHLTMHVLKLLFQNISSCYNFAGI